MKLESMTWKELLGTEHTIAERLFDGKTYPWEVLGGIGEFITTLGPLLPENEYRKLGKDIWIHKTARMAPGVAAAGPMIICAGAQVRQGAFLRGKVRAIRVAVVGNSCELKNAVLFDEVQVPHFNYVGDSILGYKAHMGAGAVTSNVKSDKTLVKVHAEDGDVETGLKKFGAILATMWRLAATASSIPEPSLERTPTFIPYPACGAVFPQTPSTRIRTILW